MTATAIPLPRQRPLNQAQERTEFLIETLGSGARLAALIGVNRSQPTKWRRGIEVPGPEAGRMLIDLDHIVARACMVWPGELVTTWLSSPNAFLDGATPVTVLREQGSRAVIDALDAEQAGSYA